jgi:hypothetical protein
MVERRYLLCPQCGTHRFFLKDENGKRIYFHVDWDKAPFPTETSQSNLTDKDYSIIHSTGCSWTGTVNGLVKYLR